MPNEIRPELREGVYYAVGAFDGRRIRKSLKTRDEEEAYRQCALLQSKLWERRSFGEAAVRTFEEAAVSYQEQGGEGRFLKPILRHFRGKPIGKITPGDVRQMALILYPKAGPATRNRQAIVPARAVIRHAHSRGWCAPLSVELFPVPKSRKHKPVDRAWLDAFLAQSDKDKLPHLSACVLFMNQTSTRVSEAIRIVGSDIRLSERLVILGRTKENEDEVRYLTAELVARIVALGAGDDDRVFSYTDPKAINRRMQAVCARAGIPYRSTHSAGRHSFATTAMESGVDVKDAMDAGGWKTARLFMETYVHSHNAGRRVAEIFDRKTGPFDANQSQGIKRKRNRFGKTSG